MNIFLEFFRLADAIWEEIPGGEFILSPLFEQRKHTDLVSRQWPFHELIEALAMAQHHGIPTRLLDFSYSPLVAAYFAAYSALEHRRNGTKIREFSVWAVNLGFVEHAWGNWQNRRVQIVKVPLARNPFLQAQKGLFIYDTHVFKNWSPSPLDHVILERGTQLDEWDSLRETIGRGTKPKLPPLMRKFKVPVDGAYELLEILYDSEDISRAHLMPTLDNVTQTLSYMNRVKQRM